jgi:DNA-binding MarR family transcriptional regulator
MMKAAKKEFQKEQQDEKLALTNLGERLCRLLDCIVSRTMIYRLLGGVRATDTSWCQFQGLMFLAEHQGSRIGDLAHGLAVSYPAATKLVDRLEKKGWAVREDSKEDRRVVRIMLTEQGLGLHERLQAERAAQIGEILASLPARRRVNLVEDLERVVNAVLEDKGG